MGGAAAPPAPPLATLLRCIQRQPKHFQDGMNSQRGELLLNIDFNTDTTIVLAVLGVVKVLKHASSIKYRSQLIVASFLNAKIYIAF